MNILLVRWRYHRNLFLTTNILPCFYVDFMLYCLGCGFTLHDTIVLLLNICSMYLVRNDRNKTVQSINRAMDLCRKNASTCATVGQGPGRHVASPGRDTNSIEHTLQAKYNSNPWSCYMNGVRKISTCRLKSIVTVATSEQTLGRSHTRSSKIRALIVLKFEMHRQYFCRDACSISEINHQTTNHCLIQLLLTSITAYGVIRPQWDKWVRHNNADGQSYSAA